MIELKNVSVGYKKRDILLDLSCIIEKNSFSCLIGANGSGKTTLLKALAGLVKVHGSIFYNGRMLNEILLKDRAKLISYLPQVRHASDLHALTLIEHGRFPHMNFSQSLTQVDKDAIERAVFLTDTESLLYKEINKLSGGERQRVYLAMAIAQDTEVILLDEPTTYLDINYQLEIIHIISKLHKQGKTIVMVSHDLPQAFSVAEKIIFLDGGRLIGCGTPEEICERGDVRTVFGVDIRKVVNGDLDMYQYKIVRGD